MSDSNHEPGYPLGEAIKAQTALRDAAGLAPESFPLSAFVGRISDEIEALRSLGESDERIAQLICGSSTISITADQIRQLYASSEQRYPPGE